MVQHSPQPLVSSTALHWGVEIILEVGVMKRYLPPSYFLIFLIVLFTFSFPVGQTARPAGKSKPRAMNHVGLSHGQANPAPALTLPGPSSVPAGNGGVSAASPDSLTSLNANKAGTMILPSKFLGWKMAAKLGGDYLARFARRRAGLASLNAVSFSQGRALAESSEAPSPTPGFDFRPTLPADFIPTAVVTGDFNGDGHMDWAVANGGSNNIWVYLGKGDGTAQLPTIVTLKGTAPVGLAAVDMNHDGKLDLVVAEADSSTVGILLGNGDGTFGAEREFSLPGNPSCMAVSDFNGDGNPDVVVGVAGELAFLPGDGKGNLGTPVISAGATATQPVVTFDLAVADLNNDGKPDIVALDYRLIEEGADFWDQMPYAGAYVYLNAGNGLFNEGQQFYFDSNDDPVWGGIKSATAVALGDVNGDGCADAVVLDSEGVATLFTGNCNGTFNTTNPPLFGAGILAAAATLVDVNGDGKLDLVTSAFQIITSGLHNPLTLGNCVSVQFGDGTGNFSAPTLFRGEYGMYSFAVADLNGDGYPDVVTANQDNDSASVYLNDGTGRFGAPSGGYLGNITTGLTNEVYAAPTSNFVLQDVNNDGIKDLVLLEATAASHWPDQLTVLLGDGTGKFGRAIRSSLFPAANNPEVFDFALADFQNRGLPDLLILGEEAIPGQQSSPPFIAYVKNNGDGTFQAPVLTPTPNACPEYFVVGDFNQDGKLDFMGMSVGCGPAGAPVLDPYLGNGDGTFREGTPISFNTTGSPAINGMLAVDVNGDGKLDLLISGNALISPSDANALYEMLGNGDGTFQAPKLLFSNPSATSYFATADLNQDGIPDLVEVAFDNSSGQATYRTYLGQSGGTFQLTGTYGPFITNHSWRVSDASLLYGAPGKPLWPLEPTLADFNGDGKVDVLAYLTGTSGAVVTSGGITMTITGAWSDTLLQVLAGNGDGTLTPSNVFFNMGDDLAPQLAGDVNGDGRADLIEMDSYSSSYNVITAQPGNSFSVALVSSPILGTSGNLEVALAFASSTATTVQLSASDPYISLPASVTIPSGSVVQDVPFQIGTNFNPSHVFGLTGQIGSETHTAYGSQATSTQGLGIAVAPATGSGSFATVDVTPSQPASFEFYVASLGGYSTELQGSCQGLPTTGACQFNPSPLYVGAGTLNTVTVTITTGLNAPLGTYSPTVVLTDGSVSQQVSVPLVVGTFALSISPASQTTASNGEVSYSFWLSGSPGYSGPVYMSVSGLPTGSPDPLNSVMYTTAAPAALPISTFSATPGSYLFSITGTAGPLTQSASATLVVQGTGGTPSISDSISPTSATASTVQSANFTITLDSQGGATGAVTLQCSGLPSGATCAFIPASPTLPANGGVTDTLTVQVTSSVAAGSYPFMVTATSGSLTASTGATLVVQPSPSMSGSIAPTSATVVAGLSGSFTVTLNSQYGATGTVNFQCSGLPSGATCTFNPLAPTLPANGSVSDALTVQVASSVAAGSYPFTVLATSGSLNQSATATLQVQAGPNFSSTITPSSATVSVGQSANFAITLNSQNGATGTVSFQCSGLPSGTTCTFNPLAPTLPVNGSVSDTLTVQVNSMPAATSPRAPAPWPYPPDRLGTFWLFVIRLAAGSTLSMKIWERRRRLVPSAAVLLSIGLFFLVTASCGGGGGSGPAPPAPSPVVVTIPVQANGAGVTAMQTLGNLTITVN
jgi:hypothetical protein